MKLTGIELFWAKIQMESVCAEISLEMPEGLWLAEVSKRYATSTFYILSFLPTKELIGNALIRIEGGDISRILEEIRIHPSLMGMSILVQQRDSALINARTRDPWLLSAMMESEVLLKPPIRVKQGIAEWIVISTKERISKLMKLLDQRGVSYQLRSVGAYTEKPLLTSRQSEVLSLALQRGYYDSPRRTSLAKLARELGISKSTLWEILRSAERKMILKR